MPSNFFKITIYVILLNSLGYIATEVYLPSLPSIEAYFQTKESYVQLTLFSYLLSFTVAPIVFGPLSDKYGRSKIIRLGMWIGLFATIAATFSSSIMALVVARFVQGLGLGAVVVVSRSILPDFYQGIDLNRQTSILAITIPLFVAISPIIGGIIEEFYTWQYVFVFLSCYVALVMFVMTKMKIPQKNSNDKSLLSIMKDYGVLLRNPHFMAYISCMTVPMVGFFSYLAAGPFLYQEVIGLSPAQFGSLSLCNAAMIMTMGYVNTRLINYFSPEAMIGFAIGCMVAASLCLGLGLYFQWHLFWALLISSSLFICSVPVMHANANQRAFSFVSQNYGLASAMIAAMQFAGGVIGTLIFIMIEKDSAFSLMFCYLACALVGVLLLSYCLYLNKKRLFSNFAVNVHS